MATTANGVGSSSKRRSPASSRTIRERPFAETSDARGMTGLRAVPHRSIRRPIVSSIWCLPMPIATPVPTSAPMLVPVTTSIGTPR